MRFDRTLILAPHPDDDVIAAGGLIQHVVASGGQLHVLFVTDGESNPWPQRWMLRRWSITDADRVAWAAMRRDEARASLASLGVAHVPHTFLALPDRALSTSGVELERAITATIEAFQPTLIVTPSLFDLHADHRALARAAHRAAAGVPVVTYVVHGSGAQKRIAFRIALNDVLQRRKRIAIECHRSQMVLSRARFLAHVKSAEFFYAAEFDLMTRHSAMGERLAACRHAIQAVFSAAPWEASGIETTADVEDRPGDVAGLL